MANEKIIYMKLSEIEPYENNPRFNEDSVDRVANSIKAFGFKQPIVVDANNVIIAGHTRYKAAKQIGLSDVPVIVASDLSEDEVKAYRLADNKVGEASSWDFEALNIELSELMDFDMGQFGFEFDSIDEASLEDIVEDEVPEEPENPESKLGDVYALGDHLLMCGDSTSEEDVSILMAGDKASMVFTDPPWNVNYGGSNHPKWKNRKIMNDSMETEDFKTFMDNVFARMKESIHPGAMTYVVMSAQEWGNLMLSLNENGFHWSSTIIWAKDTMVLGRKDYHPQYEPIWYGWEGSESRLCPLTDRTQTDLWEIPRPKKSDEHPTMKPVSLVARAVQNSSMKGDIILDLFGESGTTLIACEQTKRKCRMMELSPGYVDVIRKRWEELTGSTAELVRRLED